MYTPKEYSNYSPGNSDLKQRMLQSVAQAAAKENANKAFVRTTPRGWLPGKWLETTRGQAALIRQLIQERA